MYKAAIFLHTPMGAEGKSPSRKKKDDPRILVIMWMDGCAIVKFEKPCTDRMSSPFFFTRYKKFMICPSFVLDRKCGVHAFTLLLLTCGRLEYLHLTELKCFRCVLITHLYIHCYSPQRVCAFEIFCFSRVLRSDRASSEIQRCNKKI